MGVGDRPWLLRGAVVGLALVVGVVAWLATRGGDSEPAATEPAVESRLISTGELPQIAAQSGHPVYWAGPIPATNLELTELDEGGEQVRYLPEGAEAGDEDAALTIGSYPLPDPSGALEAFANRPSSVTHRGKNGREVVLNKESPTSVYFASPDNSVQVEVYDPSPERALRLALSGRVQPAG
jgi:hypothetical protein